MSLEQGNMLEEAARISALFSSEEQIIIPDKISAELKQFAERLEALPTDMGELKQRCFPEGDAVEDSEYAANEGIDASIIYKDYPDKGIRIRVGKTMDGQESWIALDHLSDPGMDRLIIAVQTGKNRSIWIEATNNWLVKEKTFPL